MTSPALLILAAGMGNRYGGLKQIDPIGPNGETILDYSVYDALRAGFGRLVFVIRKEIKHLFKEKIGARFAGRISVDYVFQELDTLPEGHSVPLGRTKPWGTAHAILMAAEAIREPFAVINADDFYGEQSFRALAQYLQSSAMSKDGGYAMVGFTLRNTLSEFGAVARGVCQVDEKGYLESIVEMTSIERDDAGIHNIDSGHVIALTGSEVVSMNMWGFTPHIFGQLCAQFEGFLNQHGSELQSECYLPSAVNALVLTGQVQVKVLRTTDTWFGVTYRDDHKRVVESIRRLIQAGYYPNRL